MQQEEGESLKVNLLDGRTLDIRTKSGANAFLQDGTSGGSRNLSRILEKMCAICAKCQLNEEEKSSLIWMNMMFDSLARKADHSIFREHVEQSLLKAWFDHAIEQIKKLSTKRHWITTGELPLHEYSLLESCISMMWHRVPIGLAFEGKFFNALADFVKARKGGGRALPCDDICDVVFLIVSSAYLTGKAAYNWTTEKALKKLEATGILVQFFRCATAPPPEDLPTRYQILDDLQMCTPFINKYVRPGEPCGDVIFAIIIGRDGHSVACDSVLNRLRNTIQVAASIDPNQKTGEGYKICDNCGKGDRAESFQNSLKKCARCKIAYYCSKECQKAAWKIHKKTCKPMNKKQVTKSENLASIFYAFCEFNYVHIMVKLVEACGRAGLTKDEMLVELNFTPDKNGIVPPMKRKPEFKIAPVKDYIEGSRPAEPDWFSKNIDRKVYEHNLEFYLSSTKEQYRKMLPHQILCLVRYEGGTIHTFLYERDDPTTRKELFTQEAVLAFNAYMEDDDDGPLSEILGPEPLLQLKREYAEHYGQGISEEEIMQEHMSNIRLYDAQYGGLPPR